MTNLNVPINWVHHNGDPDKASGFVAGVSAFTAEQVLPGAYRLRVHLPRPLYETREWTDSFHTSMQAAKDAAPAYAERVYRDLANSVVEHPAIRYIEKVTQFVFPGQLCRGDCKGYGGDRPHDDVTVERFADGQWTIARPDGDMYRNPSQEWGKPASVVTVSVSARMVHGRDPDISVESPAVWLEGFLWPLDEALEQVTFMHCG